MHARTVVSSLCRQFVLRSRAVVCSSLSWSLGCRSVPRPPAHKSTTYHHTPLPVSFRALHSAVMSRRSGRVAALQERDELLALQKRLEAEEKADAEEDDEAAFTFNTVDEPVDDDEVQVIDSPPPPSNLLNRRIQLPVRKKTAKGAAKGVVATPGDADVVITETTMVVVDDADGKEDGDEEDEDVQDEDDEEIGTGEDEEYVQKKKTPAGGKKQTKAKTKATASAASPKAKAARAPAKRQKREKAKATPFNGNADDPIELSDEEGAKAAQDAKKKKPRPKKVKAVPVIECIRPVPSAQPNSRKLIGAHVSAGGGVQYAPHNAALMGARAFAMDTRSKRRWESPPYTAETIAAFHATMQHYGYTGDKVLPHGSYLQNLGSLVDTLYNKSKLCIQDELERCQQLGITAYNFHPGRFSLPLDELEANKLAEKERKKAKRERERSRKQRLKKGEEVSEDEEDDGDNGRLAARQAELRKLSLHRLIDALNWAHTLPSCKDVCIVLETMAGGATTLGCSFEELKYIIDRVHNQQRIGVCVDTCHIFASDERYDIRTRDTYERMMRQLEEVVGMKYVKGVHLNDSKMGLGSKRDRHENIGDGEIGMEAFRLLMNDSRWDGVPILLETPCKTAEKEKLKAEKKRLKELGAVKAESTTKDEDAEGEDDDADEKDMGTASNGKGKAKAGKAVKTKKRKSKDDEDDGGEDDEDDDEGGDGAAPKKKEKEDWVKSYTEEIALVYSLEGPSSKEVKSEAGVKTEATAVKKEVVVSRRPTS